MIYTLSQVMDSILNVIQTHKYRANNSEISDKVVLEIQSIVGSLLLRENLFERARRQDLGGHPDGSQANLPKKKSMFAYYIRDVQITVLTVVILLKATKQAEREQIKKSHWLNNVSRAHFIGR